MFYFKHFNNKEIIELLQESHVTYNILVGLLDLHWLSLMDVCIHLAKLLEPSYALCLLHNTVEKLLSTFAHKEKYARICVKLSAFFNKKKSESNYSYRVWDWKIWTSIMWGLFLNDGMSLIKMMKEFMSVEERKKLHSYFVDVELKEFTSRLSNGGVEHSFTYKSLIPPIEKREKIFSDEKYVAFVSSLIEN